MTNLRAKKVIYSKEMAGIPFFLRRVIMADPDLTRSLFEAVSRAISETVSAVLAQVGI